MTAATTSSAASASGASATATTTDAMTTVGGQAPAGPVRTVLAERGDASREQLIPLLQDIQSREGYVSQASMSELAAALGMPVSRIYGVATFYNQFRFAPLGEHVIEVCRGTACHVKQSLTLYQHLQRRLKLRPDGNSPDGRFSVISVACLGAGSIAPVMKLDGEFHGHLTVESVNALLDGVSEPAVAVATAAGNSADSEAAAEKESAGSAPTRTRAKARKA